MPNVLILVLFALERGQDAKTTWYSHKEALLAKEWDQLVVQDKKLNHGGEAQPLSLTRQLVLPINITR